MMWWYVVAVSVPFLVDVGVFLYAFPMFEAVWNRRLRRAERTLRDRGEQVDVVWRSWEETVEDFKRAECDPVARLVFRPDLLRCRPMLSFLSLFLGVSSTSIGLFQGVASRVPAVVALVISCCSAVAMVLPGVPRPALPRLLVPVTVGVGVGVATISRWLPAWCGWVSPAAVSVGFALVFLYEGWVRDPGITTVWDRVVETARRYPLVSLECAEKWTAYRILIHTIEEAAGLKNYQPPDRNT